MTADETVDGRAIADALVVLGNCLHRISTEKSGRLKVVPPDGRDPTDFIRRSMTKLLERYRDVLKIEMGNMYQQPGKTFVKGAN